MCGVSYNVGLLGDIDAVDICEMIYMSGLSNWTEGRRNVEGSLKRGGFQDIRLEPKPCDKDGIPGATTGGDFAS
jgi:hypothetical protein